MAAKREEEEEGYHLAGATGGGGEGGMGMMGRVELMLDAEGGWLEGELVSLVFCFLSRLVLVFWFFFGGQVEGERERRIGRTDLIFCFVFCFCFGGVLGAG